MLLGAVSGTTSLTQASIESHSVEDTKAVMVGLVPPVLFVTCTLIGCSG